MREIRLSGSEGGGTEINRSFLPLSATDSRDHGVRQSLTYKLMADR